MDTPRIYAFCLFLLVISILLKTEMSVFFSTTGRKRQALYIRAGCGDLFSTNSTTPPIPIPPSGRCIQDAPVHSTVYTSPSTRVNCPHAGHGLASTHVTFCPVLNILFLRWFLSAQEAVIVSLKAYLCLFPLFSDSDAFCPRLKPAYRCHGRTVGDKDQDQYPVHSLLQISGAD